MSTLQKLWAAVLSILDLMPSCVYASSFSLPSIPPCFETKWDMSKKDNVVEQEFYVSKDYVYEIDMALKTVHVPASSEEKKQMHEFIGDGNSPSEPQSTSAGTPDEIRQAWDKAHRAEFGDRPDKINPGTIIPIHFKVERLDSGKVVETIADRTIDSAGMYAGGSRGFLRDIDGVKLRSGTYKITINANLQVTLPPNSETNLWVCKVHS